MTEGRSSLLSNRMMWIGFGLGAGLDILNGLHFLYPIIPGLGGRLYDLRPFFTNKPWNAIGWTPVAIFPYAVGLAILNTAGSLIRLLVFLPVLESRADSRKRPRLALHPRISLY